MNEERLHHAFLEGRFDPVQPASPAETLLWSELPHAPDGRFLIAHLQRELLAEQQKHELHSATASSNVLTGRLVADKGLELKSLAVVPREVSLGPTPPPSPPAAFPTSTAQPASPASPVQPSGAQALARSDPASSATSLAMPTEQLKFPSGVSPLQAQLAKDKDTHRVRRILQARKRGAVRTHEDLDIRLAGVSDEIRVRRMISEIEPHTPPSTTRKGEVHWDDVVGISGYLPFESPVMVVGELREIASNSNSLAGSTIKLRARRAMLPANLKVSKYFKARGGQLLELHVESDEVGLRLAQFLGRGTVRVKVIVSREVPEHGRWKLFVVEVYREGLGEAERQAHVDWVARELARVAPAGSEWFDAAPAETDANKED